MHQMVCSSCGRLATRLYGGEEGDEFAECWDCIEPEEDDPEQIALRNLGEDYGLL